MPQRIFHYTSIQALALILSSRRFRFTRLDNFDDIYEAQAIGKFDFGQLLFASSWTANEEEDLPQWSMYGDAMRGVRISLPPCPFDWHKYEPLPDDLALDTEVPLPMEEALSDTHKVIPFLERNHFLREVDYVDDVLAAWQDRVTLTNDESFVAEDPRALARFKGKPWLFQREHRFVLMAQGRAAKNSEVQVPRPPPFMHIDVPLSADALSSLHLTLGPLRTSADRLIVDALVAKHVPSTKIEESALLDSIRPR